MPGVSIKEAGLDGDMRALLITRAESVRSSQHNGGMAAKLYLRSEVETSVAKLAEIDQLAPTAASKIMADLAKDGTAQSNAARLVRGLSRSRSPLSRADRDQRGRLAQGRSRRRRPARATRADAQDRGAQAGP